MWTISFPKDIEPTMPSIGQTLLRRGSRDQWAASASPVGPRKDGIEFPVEISLSHVKTQSGVSITAVVRDVTERKRMEDRCPRSPGKLHGGARGTTKGSREIESTEE